jgi:hypothetical protein
MKIIMLLCLAIALLSSLAPSSLASTASEVMEAQRCVGRVARKRYGQGGTGEDHVHGGFDDATYPGFQEHPCSCPAWDDPKCT